MKLFSGATIVKPAEMLWQRFSRREIGTEIAEKLSGVRPDEFFGKFRPKRRRSEP
jgi:hypothetical protein